MSPVLLNHLVKSNLGLEYPANSVNPVSTALGLRGEVLVGMESSPGRNLLASDAPPGSKASSERDDKAAVLLTPDKAADGKPKRKKMKRLVWTNDLHLRFVAAVFEPVGVKNASPKALLSLMETRNPETEGLTIEHIKSHLQKYRINYKRSRLEDQRVNEKHAKRSSKLRHYRHASVQHGSVGEKVGGEGAAESIEDTSVLSASAGVAATTRLQDPDQQWNMCDALLLEDEALEQHMHVTMQQRMDFHRELLLTRSVEFTSGSSWASRLDSVDGSGVHCSRAASTDGNHYEQHEQDTHNSSFLQAWAKAEQLRQQEAQVYGRLHQQQQSLFWQQQQQQQTPPVQDAMAITHMSVNSDQASLARTVSRQNSTDTADDIDPASWGRLSLTVDPDDEDLFGFLA